MDKKTAQALPGHTPPKRVPATMEAYPDYSKSLTHQRHQDPVQAGISRGIGTGITGAALGALITRIVTDNRTAVAGGAALGGAIGAGVGYGSGKNEAESEYSKLLFLRRRLGMNEPGEFEALQKHPALISQMIDKKGSVKMAMSPVVLNILKTLGVIGAGAGGYVAGTEGTSRLIGYHDDPAARHVGGYVNAANATAIALALALRKTPHGAQAMQALLHPGTMGAMAGMEVIPSALRSANRVADASEGQGSRQLAPSIGRALTSDTGRGAGVGAGLAGLASVVTGLSRARTDKEIGLDTSRTGMIAKDFGKYVLPAALAGGVVGSLRKQN